MDAIAAANIGVEKLVPAAGYHCSVGGVPPTASTCAVPGKIDAMNTTSGTWRCVPEVPAPVCHDGRVNNSLGPPPDPTALAACIPELAEKVSKLLKLIPQLSLPYTIIGIIDLVIDTLRQARDQLLHLQQQMQQILGAIDRATELEDAGLMAITSCAQANVATEAANVGKALASLGKLIGILNIFLGMVGAPEVPDLSNLAGRPLDEVVPRRRRR